MTTAHDQWIIQGTDLSITEFWILDCVAGGRDDIEEETGATRQQLRSLIRRGWLDTTLELTDQAVKFLHAVMCTVSIRRRNVTVVLH